jgi:hypothetical protein
MVSESKHIFSTLDEEVYKSRFKHTKLVIKDGTNPETKPYVGISRYP